MLAINARPAPVEVDPKRCAVIVVDMQNDFGAAGGMFDRAGIDIEGIVEAAEATRPVLKAARDAGLPIIYLKMEHCEDLADAGPTDGPHWSAATARSARGPRYATSTQRAPPAMLGAQDG